MQKYKKMYQLKFKTNEQIKFLRIEFSGEVSGLFIIPKSKITVCGTNP